MQTNLARSEAAANLYSLQTPADKQGEFKAIEPPAGLPTIKKAKSGDSEISMPVTYMSKDVISVGDHVNTETGEHTPVDKERIDNWVRNFETMIADGLDIRANVDHSEDSKDDLGPIVKAYRQGDKMYMVHAFVGEDAAKTAMRVGRSSVGIHRKFTGPNGKFYGDSIIHNAITPIPVVPGQGDFVPLSASRGAGKAPLFTLAAPLRSTAMPLTQEQQTKIRELGAGDDITEDKVVGFLLAKIDLNAGDVRQNLSRATSAETELKDLRAKLNTKESEIQELSRKAQVDTIPQSVLGLMARAVRSEKEKAVTTGGVTPAIADELELLMIGSKDAPNVTLLSRNAPGTSDPFALAIFSCLSRNKPVPAPGTVTATQPLPRPETEAAPKPSSPERIKELLAMG